MKKSKARAGVTAIGMSLITASLLTGCSGGSAEAVSNEPSKGEISALFDQWNAALQTGEPSEVAALYSDNAVLLPTVSDQNRDTRAEIEEYFVNFLAYEPSGTIDTEAVQVLDSDTAVNNGTYTFDMVKDSQPQSVKARFTFVYEKIQGRWLIVSHHSSVLPESS